MAKKKLKPCGGLIFFWEKKCQLWQKMQKNDTKGQKINDLVSCFLDKLIDFVVKLKICVWSCVTKKAKKLILVTFVCRDY